AIMCGYQSILFALLSKIFAVQEGWLPEDSRFRRFFRTFTLERGIAVGSAAVIAGLACFGVVFADWSRVGFSELDSSATLRWTVPGATMIALGFQTVLTSFFGSLLALHRR